MSAGEIFVHVLDIVLVAFLIYRLLLLVRGTRAWRIILGLMGFVIVLVVSDRVGLNTMHWLLEKATYLGPAALVVLFLPELRTAIEGFGRPTQVLTKLVANQNDDRAEARTVEEIVAAFAELAAGRIGALVVIEKDSHLDEIVANGVPMNATVSAPLLGAIFYGDNPLHDGAVIVRGDTILSAASRLPLSESVRLDPNVHMRHRAAVGVSEAFDCLALVVSEERGTISVASEGRLRRLNSHIELRNLLNRELRNMEEEPEDPKPAERSRRSRSRRGAEVKP
ncbi:MAG: diadenylate cyclase CdaA [Fimbriimonas sp.]